MENKKKGLNLRAIIPLATAIVSLVFIVVGLKDYGFWKAQPTPSFPHHHRRGAVGRQRCLLLSDRQG